MFYAKQTVGTTEIKVPITNHNICYQCSECGEIEAADVNDLCEHLQALEKIELAKLKHAIEGS